MNQLRIFIALVTAAFASGCGGASSSASPTPASAAASATPAAASTGAGHAHSHADHGAPQGLGERDAGGGRVAVTQLGHVVNGEEAAFSIAVAGLAPTRVRGWLGPADRSRAASVVALAEPEDGSWHLHLEPMKVLPVGEPLQIELTVGAATYVLSLDPIYSGPHGGVAAPFSAGETRGFVELRWDPNTAELELWIARDPGIEQPLDLPVTAAVHATLAEPAQRVRLRLRDSAQNADFHGTPNLRDGKTNYFTFPGDSDEESAWLMDEEIATSVTVTFEIGGTAATAGPFRLAKVQHMHPRGE